MKRKQVEKRPIDPRRIRCIPKEGFSWIDRRFVRQGLIEELPRETILLYLFLATVSDAKGLSFYADPTISRLLKLNAEELSQARSRLRHAELVLYRYPLYQVLPVPSRRADTKVATAPPSADGPRGGEPMSLQEFFALVDGKVIGAEGCRSRGK